MRFFYPVINLFFLVFVCSAGYSTETKEQVASKVQSLQMSDFSEIARNYMSGVKPFNDFLNDSEKTGLLKIIREQNDFDNSRGLKVFTRAEKKETASYLLMVTNNLEQRMNGKPELNALAQNTLKGNSSKLSQYLKPMKLPSGIIFRDDQFTNPAPKSPTGNAK